MRNGRVFIRISGHFINIMGHFIRISGQFINNLGQTVSPFGDLYNVPYQKRRHFVRLREERVVQEAVLRDEKRVSAVFCPLSKRGMRVFMCFFQKLYGFFHIVDERQHTCDDVFPTIKKVWVSWKVGMVLNERRNISPSELAQWFF